MYLQECYIKRTAPVMISVCTLLQYAAASASAHHHWATLTTHTVRFKTEKLQHVHTSTSHLSRNHTFASISLFDAQRSATHAHTTGINRLKMPSVHICNETRSCWSPCRILSSRVHAVASTSSVLLSSSPSLILSRRTKRQFCWKREKRLLAVAQSLLGVLFPLPGWWNNIQRKSKCLNSSSRKVRTGEWVLD